MQGWRVVGPPAREATSETRHSSITLDWDAHGPTLQRARSCTNAAAAFMASRTRPFQRVPSR